MDEPETACCRCCGLTRPIAELYIPPGIRDYWCVDRERCHRDEDDFDGCTIACRRKAKYTLRWGECDHAEEPPRKPPEFGFWRVFRAQDGHNSIGMASIPLLAVLPWAKHLTVDQQHQMLEEAADADDPAAVIKQWKRRADARAPVQINMLPAREPDPGFGPGQIAEAYERGRRQGRYEAGD